MFGRKKDEKKEVKEEIKSEIKKLRPVEDSKEGYVNDQEVDKNIKSLNVYLQKIN